MTAWMVYDREGFGRNAGYVAMYERHCRPYGVAVKTVLDVDVRRRVMAGERPVCAFVRTIRPELNLFFEQQEIPVFNSSLVSRICNHKGKTLERLKDLVFCVPSITISGEQLSCVLGLDFCQARSYFMDRFEYSAFRERESAVLEQADDFVLKTVDGHGGSGVFSLNAERKKLLSLYDGGQTEASSEFVLQPMIRSGGEYRDMRVYVIGDRIVAAVMRSCSEDFRANFSRGGKARHVILEPEQRGIVSRITEEFEFGMAGIDFLFDRDERLVLNEIEDVAGARMLYACAPGIDIVGEYVAYVMEQKLKIV